MNSKKPLVLIPFLLLIPFSAFSAWRIISSHGPVQIIRPDNTDCLSSTVRISTGATAQYPLPFRAFPALRGENLKTGENVCTPAGGKLLLEQNKRRVLILPQSRITVKGGKLILREGSLINGNRSLKIDFRDASTITAVPDNPGRGMTCTLKFHSPTLSGKPTLQLDYKWRSPFFKTEKTRQYKARFGVDCREWRREQPFLISCPLKNGFLLKIRSSILLRRWKTRGRDFLREFSWSGLPAVLKNKSIAPGHSFLKNSMKFSFRKKRRKRIKNRKIDRSPATFRPTIRLSAAKRRLYRKRQKILKEAKLHRKALSFSSRKALWKGNFIYPGHHFFTSIFRGSPLLEPSYRLGSPRY